VKPHRIILFARSFTILMILVFFSACVPSQAVSDYPTDTPTPQPTNVTATATVIWFPATPTETAVSTIENTPTPDTGLSYGDLVLEDTFGFDSPWIIGSYASGNVAFGNESLSLAVSVPSGSLTSFRRETYFTDLFLQINVQASLCSPKDSFGVGFWATNERNYYRLALTCEGTYRLERVREGKITGLTKWLPSAQAPRGIQTSAKIGLWVGGGLIRIYLNDEFQSQLYVNRATGGLGVFTSSNSTSATTATFMDLQVYDVQPGNYPPTPMPTLRPTRTALPTIPTP
jgi:hypothetical protein